MEKRSRRTTLLDLITAVQDCTRSDEEVIAVITHMIHTGRVVLTGTFAGRRATFAV